MLHRWTWYFKSGLFEQKLVWCIKIKFLSTCLSHSIPEWNIEWKHAGLSISKNDSKRTKNFQQSSPYNSSAVSQDFYCHFDSSWFVVCEIFAAKTALCEAVKYNTFMKVKALILWHYFLFTLYQNFFLHTIKSCSNEFREICFLFLFNLIAIANHFKGAFFHQQIAIAWIYSGVLCLEMLFATKSFHFASYQ